MLHLKHLLLPISFFIFAFSIPEEEKIEPVDLAYNCINPESFDKGQVKNPIILIHGLGGSNKNWKDVHLLLAVHTKRRVCTVDLRNHGDSLWSNRTDVEAMAIDIGHFLDRHNIKKVNFIGHSLGGKVAVHYTLKNPDRVDSIIVEDMRPNSITQEAYLHVSTLFRIRKAALETIPTGSTEDDAMKSITNFLTKTLRQMGSTERSIEQILEYVEIKLTDGKWNFKYNMKVLEESLKHPDSALTTSSGLYEGPALFIYGTKSPFRVNEDRENILKLFPKAQLLPVEGAGHRIHGRFREFDDAVISFLNKLH